jgi:hypothetical protein
LTAPERLYITPAYLDPAQAQKDKAQLEVDSLWAYDRTVDGYADTAIAILDDWATHNKVLVNHEAKLIMTFKGILFLEVYLLLGKPESFPSWVEKVYRPGAQALYSEQNNQGAWGLLGCAMSDVILGRPTGTHLYRYAEFISKATDDVGKMKIEILRTNSGMWYSYFALLPLLRTAILLDADEWMLFPALKWLWQYVEHPETWPYKLKPGLRGWIQRMIHPCALDVELPRKDDWPANLYYVASTIFNRPEWAAWGDPPPYRGVHLFRRGI